MFSIGIDIGTTKICAVLRDCETGKIIQTESADNGAFINTGRDFEKIQDVDIIVKNMFDAFGRIKKDNVISIGVTGQMHGILYIDSEGRAVSPLYTWQDGRGAEYSSLLGCPTGYGSLTDYYNEKNGLIPESAVTFCTIHDYCVMLLTGRKTPLVHSSDAASFGCYDMKKNIFTRENSRYPDVTPGVEVAGFWHDIPVSVAIGDNQAGFIGSGCGENDVLVNVGTGAQVTVMSSYVKKKNALTEIRPLYDDKFILAGSSLCGGRSYAILEKFFREIAMLAGASSEVSLYEKMNELLSSNPVPTLHFDNRFSGTRADGTIKGSITNISTENFTPVEFAAGCVKGIADELFDLYSMMGSGKTGKIIGSGNGIRKNAALAKALELDFGMLLSLSPYSEEAASGAAIFGEMAERRLGREPVFFEKNRVFRIYKGGALMDSYVGASENGGDGFYPEEWIASTVEALNRVKACEKEGVSRVAGSGLYFDDLMRLYPDRLKGGDHVRGVLVKYLDSAIRLPMQAHPDRDFALKHFNSIYGKEESWLVLATRPGACIYYGFKKGVTEEMFRKAIDESAKDREAPAALMNKFSVKPGDVFFIPAKKVHAIGYGCLILETQEPTDFTIQPEFFCGDYELNDFERFIGLSPDDAYSCFEYVSVNDKKVQPETVSSTPAFTRECLIGPKLTSCFSMWRYSVTDGSCIPSESGCVIAVTSGKGLLSYIGAASVSESVSVTGTDFHMDFSYSRPIKKGDYFFLPKSCAGSFSISGHRISFVACAN